MAAERAGALSRCGAEKRAAETAEREEEKERERAGKRRKKGNGQRSARTACTAWVRVHPQLVSFAGKSCRKITRSFMPQLSYRAIIKLASELPTYWSCFVSFEEHSVAKVHTLSARLRAIRACTRCNTCYCQRRKQMCTHTRVEVGLRLTWKKRNDPRRDNVVFFRCFEMSMG